jgi:hypothetical protein
MPWRQALQGAATPSVLSRLSRLGLAIALYTSVWSTGGLASAQDAVPASTLLDISGVAWMEKDLCVAVHDGKNDDEERERPRISLLLLPADVVAPPEFARQAAGGVYFRNLDVDWGAEVPNDLESIARIPGTRQLLLVESGDDNSDFQRIFLATLNTSDQLEIDEVVPWPTPVFNVEGSAVFSLDDQLFFVYAERAQGRSETELRWAKMYLSPLKFGPFSSARYAVRVKGPAIRPVVALEVDAAGEVYAASAYDSGEDYGPFRSFVSHIGQFRPGRNGSAHFVPSGQFADIAQQDGCKIEGVTVKERRDCAVEIYAGTDDENYGAALRQIAPIP